MGEPSLTAALYHKAELAIGFTGTYQLMGGKPDERGDITGGTGVGRNHFKLITGRHTVEFELGF